MFTCDICYNQYSSKKNMIVHHRRIHADEKLYFCDTCGKAFSRMQNAILKPKTSHTGEKKYSCDICRCKIHGNSHPGSSYKKSTKHFILKNMASKFLIESPLNNSQDNKDDSNITTKEETSDNENSLFPLVECNLEIKKETDDYPLDSIKKEIEDDTNFTMKEESNDNQDPLSPYVSNHEIKKETDGYPLDSIKKEIEDDTNFTTEEETVENKDPLFSVVECNLEIKKESDGYPLDSIKREIEDDTNFTTKEEINENKDPFVKYNLEFEEETEGVLCTPLY